MRRRRSRVFAHGRPPAFFDEFGHDIRALKLLAHEALQFVAPGEDDTAIGSYVAQRHVHCDEHLGKIRRVTAGATIEFCCLTSLLGDPGEAL